MAANAKAAERVRKILKKYGIDVNDAENGVFLPTEYDSRAGKAAIHNGSHKDSYHQALERRILNKMQEIKKKEGRVTKEHMVKILGDIRQDLLGGKLQLN